MSPLANQLVHRALHQPVDEFKRRQGKRIRGAMSQISYEFAGGHGRLSDPIVEAIECLHAGSLVIDDIQDESQYRRGMPTLHQTIGVPLAINAGNWMYFRALELLMTSPFPISQRMQLVDAMVTAGRRCHEGQAIDLHARLDQMPAHQWRCTAEAISNLKTGALVELAVSLGCIAASAPAVLSSALTAFGCQIGVALQMRNDLDELLHIATGTAGPNHGTLRDDDLRHARVTWPWVWAAELADHVYCESLTEHLTTSTHDRQLIAANVVSLVQSHGDHIIEGIISEQLRLLAEHVIDPSRLARMRDCLQPIATSRVQTGFPTNTGSGAFELHRPIVGANR
ncbi:MAG: polyprenyl synthetase family protein [Pirellulaceae bacterium]|nr:polyprenyl synthetase family protein [Pirellulaceae bacterium]